ncbi:MAG: ATP-binding protein [Pseudomonadota bacterium]
MGTYSWLLPRTIRGQMTALIVCAIALVSVTGDVIEQFRDEAFPNVVDADAVIHKSYTFALMLKGATAQDRAVIEQRGAAAGIRVEVIPRETWRHLAAQAPDRSWIVTAFDNLFAADFDMPDDAERVFIDDRFVLAFDLQDGTVALFRDFPRTMMTTDFIGPVTYYSLSFVTLIFLFSIFAVRMITEPLALIATRLRHPDRFLQGETPLPEHGSSEVADLARTLNELRLRACSLIESRGNMLRSVGHDLRTPLTRIRLRAERIAEPDLRKLILSDIGQINGLIDYTLTYLREGSGEEAEERADIASLARSVCDDFTDIGAPIVYSGPRSRVVTCRPNAIVRALTNLCENGLKFGTSVHVGLQTTDGGDVEIRVEDDGPGIPAELRSKVLTPFFKRDGARTGNGLEQGFGLGLAIVDEIVRHHAGRLVLEDNVKGGLTARIRLPAS